MLVFYFNFDRRQPEGRHRFPHCGPKNGGGGVLIPLPDMSGRRICEMTSFHVLFVLQLNCAPTEVNYVQLILAGRQIFFGGGSGARLRLAVRVLLDGLRGRMEVYREQ